MKRIIIFLFFISLLSLSNISGSWVISSFQNANPFIKTAPSIGAASGLLAISTQLLSQYYIKKLPDNFVQDANDKVNIIKKARTQDTNRVFF